MGAGCSADSFVGADAGTDHAVVFDDVWREFDLHYSFFELKHVNWDSLGAHYRPYAIAATTDEQFATVLGKMLAELNDVHVSITPTGVTNNTIRVMAHSDTIPTYFSPGLVFDKYVGASRFTSGRHLRYGMATPTIGYVYIADFSGRDWDAEMDEALEGLGSARSLVIDVRNNAGGTYDLAAAVAGRFADRSRVFGYIRRRNGPGHADFTDYTPETVSPVGTRHFPGPVTVLANRRSFSTAENFVLAMKAQPSVTIVGDTTAGASGAPIVRELPNGWTYQLSEWIEYTPARKIFEGVGIAPNIVVRPTARDAQQGIDSVLERALKP